MFLYKTLDAWQHALQLTRDVFLITKTFPSEEKFGLSQQLRRAAVSVVSNIAEGSGRFHEADKLRFMYMSRGSLFEVDTQLEVAFAAGIISREVLDSIAPLLDETAKLIGGLIKKYRTRG